MDAVNWGKVMQDSSEHGVYTEGLIKTLLAMTKLLVKYWYNKITKI
jgi:hypothetical protein